MVGISCGDAARSKASRRGERGVAVGLVGVGCVGKVGMVGAVACIGEEGGVVARMDESAWATSACGTRAEKMHARHDKVAERTGVSK